MDKIKHLDLNLLKAFDILMDERSVSRAAEKLSVTQPAVSGMLTRLRSSLEDPLFVRSQYGITPTIRALELALPVKAVLREIEQIIEPKEFVPAHTQMTLVIAATDYSLQSIIQPLISSLRVQAPNVKVSVQWIHDEKILDQMERGEIDFALMTPQSTPPTLKAKHLFEERYVCVVREGHPLADLDAITLEQFCAQDHGIVSYVGGAFAGETDKALSALGYERNVVLSVPSFLALVDTLRNSDLCAVIPSRLVKDMAALKVIGLPFEVPGFSKVLVWHERTHRSAAHRWIRSVIYDLCR